jgi:hypothetical protein
MIASVVRMFLGDRGGVLQRRACDHRGVDQARADETDDLTADGIEPAVLWPRRLRAERCGSRGSTFTAITPQSRSRQRLGQQSTENGPCRT